MTNRSELSRWIPALFRNSRSSAGCRVFCFPYAGAGASVFRKWQEVLPASIDVIPVQLPGRESRWAEAPFTNLPLLTTVLRKVLVPLLDEPYAFFGHSMGGLIAFELACELRRNDLPLPRHLYISGTRPPHVPPRELSMHHLPDSLFWKSVVSEFGESGDPNLLNPDLAPVLLPILRADFRLCEAYSPAHEAPFPFPVTVYGGRQDRRVSYSDLIAWSAYTRRGFRAQLFPGGHFFIAKDRDLFLKTFSDDLSRLSVSKNATLCAAG